MASPVSIFIYSDMFFWNDAHFLALAFSLSISPPWQYVPLGNVDRIHIAPFVSPLVSV